MNLFRVFMPEATAGLRSVGGAFLHGSGSAYPKIVALLWGYPRFPLKEPHPYNDERRAGPIGRIEHLASVISDAVTRVTRVAAVQADLKRQVALAHLAAMSGSSFALPCLPALPQDDGPAALNDG
jgi:hypothetical protein